MYCQNEQTAALFYSEPSIGSWTADPLSSVEIDAEPNADRIWATIKGLEDAADQKEQDALEVVESDHKANLDDSYNEWKKAGRAELMTEIKDVLRARTPPKGVRFTVGFEWSDMVDHFLAALPNA